MSTLRVSLLLSLAMLSGLLQLGCSESKNPVDTPNPILPASNVFIYNGTGAWPEFSGAISAALADIGEDPILIDEFDLKSNLSGYPLIVIGGGDPIEMANAIGVDGCSNLKQHVLSGGGFLALGNGSYLAADSMRYMGAGSPDVPLIGLFEGCAIGPVREGGLEENYYLSLMKVLVTEFDPEGTVFFLSMYRGGPEFVIESPEHTITTRLALATVTTGVNFELGNGRVALLSFHPEMEENDERDGTDFGSDLVDPESEWFLVQSLAKWCMREL